MIEIIEMPKIEKAEEQEAVNPLTHEPYPELLGNIMTSQAALNT